MKNGIALRKFILVGDRMISPFHVSQSNDCDLIGEGPRRRSSRYHALARQLIASLSFFWYSVTEFSYVDTFCVVYSKYFNAPTTLYTVKRLITLITLFFS